MLVITALIIARLISCCESFFFFFSVCTCVYSSLFISCCVAFALLALLAFACCCLLLLAFACFCLLLLAFACFCVLLLAFACFCLLLLAFARFARFALFCSHGLALPAVLACCACFAWLFACTILMSTCIQSCTETESKWEKRGERGRGCNGGGLATEAPALLQLGIIALV